MDVSKLITLRDNLNAHFTALIAAANVDQAKIDALVTEGTQFDTDVVAATSGGAVDFTKFNASLAKLNTDASAFAAAPNMTQATVDNIQMQIDALDAAVLASTTQ